MESCWKRSWTDFAVVSRGWVIQPLLCFNNLVISQDLKNKSVLILGAGKTGFSTANFLLGKAKGILLSESNFLSPELEAKVMPLKKARVEIEFGNNSDNFLDRSDLVIVSPGIKPHSEIIQRINKRNIPIISDIELGSYFIKKPIIAVTGTNGKTTTTSLITHIINTSGKRAVSCGNIGNPFLEVIKEDERIDFYVLELSSFQIFYSPTLSPYAAICLNITPDHLDWHLTFENYIKSKGKLFLQQKPEQWSILNCNDDILKKLKLRGKPFYFSANVSDKNIIDQNENVAFFDNENLFVKSNGKTLKLINRREIKLLGLHNIENALASIAACITININPDFIKEGLKTFQGVEHRLELVQMKKNKLFFNDSKATNPEATIKAIEAVSNMEDKTISLILGGRDKNTDLSQMIEAIKKHINEVILFGEAKERFVKELTKQNYKNLLTVQNLSEAISTSLKSKTDIVLFSPACASFDMFKNYEERGNVFKELVQKL